MKIIWWGVGVLLLMMGLVWWQWPRSAVRMIMCDVGQGDAVVMTEAFSQMLIDTGPENGNVSFCLGLVMPFWDKFVESIIITHADSDHLGGLDAVLNHYRVGTIITTQAAEQRVRQVVNNRTNVSVSWQNQQWRFGSILGLVKWPPFVPQLQNYSKENPSHNESDTNAQSLVVRLQWGDQSVWLAGDADETVEAQLLNEGLIEPSTILKVGHHGSQTASSERFLSILQPRQAWISVGKDNRYGHPSLSTLERLSRVGSIIRRTDRDGMIKTE